MHSIFHLYGSVDPEPHKHKEIDPDCQSNITERNSYTNMSETKGEETISRENILFDIRSTNSAYETAQFSNLYALTEEYLDSDSSVMQGFDEATTVKQVDLVSDLWRGTQPADYILPMMNKPPVFFGFPEDMMYKNHEY